MSWVEAVLWNKWVCVCRCRVTFGTSVAAIEFNSDIDEFDWNGGDFLSQIDVAVLCD